MVGVGVGLIHFEASLFVIITSVIIQVKNRG